jgi:hypothetical protein
MGTRALLLHPLGLSTGEDSSGPRNHESSSGPRNYEDLFRETLASGLESLPGYVEGAWPRGVTAHEKRIKENFEVCVSLKNNTRLCSLSFLLHAGQYCGLWSRQSPDTTSVLMSIRIRLWIQLLL